MALGSSESAAHSILFHFVWNEQWCQCSCTSVYWNKNQWTTKPNWFRWAFFTSVRGWSLFTSGPSPAGGQWCPAPPFEICVFPISRLTPGCSIHPIPYFLNVAPLLVFGLSIWLLAPLLLNPSDGPGSHASYHHCGKVINVREMYFCEKNLAGIRVSWVFQNYFNFVPC